MLLASLTVRFAISKEKFQWEWNALSRSQELPSQLSTLSGAYKWAVRNALCPIR